MNIIRDGIEIELTEQEMISAYYEQQHKWDVEYITESLLDEYIDGSENEKDILMNDRLRSEPELANKVAYRYRKYLEDVCGNDTEWNCLQDAYDYICECNGENPYPDRKKHLDRLKDEFNKAIKDLEHKPGCYEVEIMYDGELHWTEGDVHKDTTWDDFFAWLITDLAEMDLNRLWLLKIISVDYNGIDDPEVFMED